MVDERWKKPDSSREFLIQKLKTHPGSNLLDIGAGTGKWSVLCAPYAEKVTALEPSRAMQDILKEKIQALNIENIRIVTGTWPDHDIARHDFILASHSMYGVRDFKSFVLKMSQTAKKGCILVMRAPLADAVMAKAARRVFGHPYDSPNFQIAYNILLGMDIYPDVIMEKDGTWPGWHNTSIEDALSELKNRLDLNESDAHDRFLKQLLEAHLIQEEDRVTWPSGNRSALLYWEV